MRLISLALEGQFKGLKDQFFDFSGATGNVTAFIGLNGSGKSQLLELIAEIFAYLERQQRSDFKSKSKSKLGWTFTLIYQIRVLKDQELDVVKLSNSNDKLEAWVNDEPCVVNGVPFPDFIVGYSSGLNESLQRPFMKNMNRYYEVMRVRSLRRKELSRASFEQKESIDAKYLKKHGNIFNYAVVGEGRIGDPDMIVGERDTELTRFVLVDYDSALLVLTSISMLPVDELKSLFGELTFNRVCRVKFRYNLRGKAVFEEDSISDLQLLIRIAGENKLTGIGQQTSDEEYDEYELDYLSGDIEFDLTDRAVVERLKSENYSDPFFLFKRLYKLQLLGAKNWGRNVRQELSRDNFYGAVKKPLKTKMPLVVDELILADDQGRQVDYNEISDGEAQFMQILAATKLFSNQSRGLFLYDEPETHLNPSWRTQFHSYLENALDKSSHKDSSSIFLSTHSPFMISSLHKENIRLFKRDKSGDILMEELEGETYGASFEVLIKNHFGLKSLISQSAIDEVKQKLKSLEQRNESGEEVRSWVERNIGDSMEKGYLLRRLDEK